MYHNELCNFPAEWLHKKKCNSSCEHWATCTRKNSYDWEAYLLGLKRPRPTNNQQKQIDLMSTRDFHYNELLVSIEEVNNTIKQMAGGIDNE